MTTALDNYHARLLRVLDYIDAHLDQDLDLDVLSRVAAISKFHFHRQFAATFEVSVHRYVQLTRMKRATHALAWNEAQSVTDIAMDAGYEAPDAFARAFRQRLTQSPSSFRKSPDWSSWLSAFGPLDSARNKLMKIIFDYEDIIIREVPSTPVALLRHRGDRAKLPQTFETFRAWCKAAGLAPETGRSSFMVFRSEREPVNPEDYSMDICVAADPEISVTAPMQRAVIEGGRCAVLRYPGQTNNLEPAGLFMYRDWLPQSGEEARDFPAYVERKLVPVAGTQAHEVVVELHLPLK
ncbi:AraC family transcriptional regulator [Devosia rhizoryzae]|uniref:AraC family transcriptional regulator n=1 Tax=Devosia rhizoryzae TaxID=2774137 RepID=A0ABX7C3F0_9HYPH|nr:AraC family transcriptional regulator [Devosia rhizoryzae]QQR38746.1 AraC family transcriptional regulator [Devosia rhizoryzae]